MTNTKKLTAAQRRIMDTIIAAGGVVHDTMRGYFTPAGVQVRGLNGNAIRNLTRAGLLSKVMIEGANVYTVVAS